MTRNQKTLSAYEMTSLEVAMTEADQMPTTPEIQRMADRIGDFARTQSTGETAHKRTKKITGRVRSAILAMSDAAVRSRLFELFTRHPDLQVAYRGATGEMSDTDRKSLLEDVLSMLDLPE